MANSNVPKSQVGQSWDNSTVPDLSEGEVVVIICLLLLHMSIGPEGITQEQMEIGG